MGAALVWPRIAFRTRAKNEAMEHLYWRARQVSDTRLQPTPCRSRAAMSGSPRRQGISHEAGHLRGAVSRPATARQSDVLAAFVAAGGSVTDAKLVGIQPSTVKRHLADLRARSGLPTEQLTTPDELRDGSSFRVWSPLSQLLSGHAKKVSSRVFSARIPRSCSPMSKDRPTCYRRCRGLRPHHGDISRPEPGGPLGLPSVSSMLDDRIHS